jgi:hypothetical protein
MNNTSYEAVWEVTVKQPHTVVAVRKVGLLRDTLDIQVDGETVLSTHVTASRLHGSDVIWIDDEPVEVSWQWGSVSGAPKSLTMVHDGRVIAAYGKETGVTSGAARVESGERDSGSGEQDAGGGEQDAGGGEQDLESGADSVPLAERKLAVARIQLERRLRNGASWFYWIAGLSLLNSVTQWLGFGLDFLAGLAATQVIDGTISLIGQELGLQANGWLIALALPLDVLVAGMFAVLGKLAMKQHRGSYLIGIVLYALDGIVFLAFGAIPNFVFHLFALWGLFGGFRALRSLHALGKVQAGEPVVAIA